MKHLRNVGPIVVKRKGNAWASYQICKITGCACAGCREHFPRHRGSAIQTCFTARASRTCRDTCRDRLSVVSFDFDGGENVPSIPGACAIHNFTYLESDPWIGYCVVWPRFWRHSWVLSFNFLGAMIGDVWIIPSFRIWSYLLHVEHISCVMKNCGQHQWVAPSLFSVAL